MSECRTVWLFKDELKSHTAEQASHTTGCWRAIRAELSAAEVVAPSPDWPVPGGVAGGQRPDSAGAGAGEPHARTRPPRAPWWFTVRARRRARRSGHITAGDWLSFYLTWWRSRRARRADG